MRIRSAGKRPPVHPRAASCSRCANIALPPLVERWQRESDSRVESTEPAGSVRVGRNYRPVRYADNFVVLVAGTEARAEAVNDEVATVLAPTGRRLSAAKTRVVPHREDLDLWDSASSGTAGRAPGATTSTPIHRRPRSAAVRRKVKSISRKARTDRSPTCCANSTWCCGDGSPTSGMAWPPRPSATCATTAGAGWSTGCGTDTGAAVKITRYRYRGDRIPSPCVGVRPHVPRGQSDRGMVASGNMANRSLGR